MKIKVGDQMFDGKEVPIMVILSDKDKENISNMAYDVIKYCEFPDGMPVDDVKAFMEMDGTDELTNVSD